MSPGEAVARAKEQYQDDDISFDDDPATSAVEAQRGVVGFWVAAWVWVPDEEEE